MAERVEHMRVDGVVDHADRAVSHDSIDATRVSRSKHKTLGPRLAGAVPTAATGPVVDRPILGGISALEVGRPIGEVAIDGNADRTRIPSLVTSGVIPDHAIR